MIEIMMNVWSKIEVEEVNQIRTSASSLNLPSTESTHLHNPTQIEFPLFSFVVNDDSLCDNQLIRQPISRRQLSKMVSIS